jgi:3,4-dihydroxy 2-butanone 4-phosphate synthase/GTP cyclohydrolase II
MDLGSTPDDVLIPVEEGIARIARGEALIVVDDEDRENEGDLIVAADLVTPESVNFMARHGRGLICIALTPERCDELDLPLMVEKNTSAHGTAFCVTVEARDGTTTGISAHDRAATVRALVDPATRPDGLRRPGHMFPLRAQRGGVLKRAGHTEAAVDLTRLAGLTPAGVLCEIMDDDGEMARLPRLRRFAGEHSLGVITVADLIAYRMMTEKLVERVAGPMLPTEYGEFRIYAYRNHVTGEEHVALVMGDIDPEVPTLVRVHSQCLTGDIFAPAVRLRASARRRPAPDISQATESSVPAPEGGASACSTSCGPTSFRTEGPTRSRRTSTSGSRQTPATTGPAPKSCTTSV